ncbi:hypothetical protein [uncultured Microscilla sp.]|uniref:hypothetical protein n=1 Tax=uncultured Microscilla sp. TaxID=432653 RepID=UPI00260C8B4F|nr:hypothetical protein [uncultured Microscilla sp.]
MQSIKYAGVLIALLWVSCAWAQKPLKNVWVSYDFRKGQTVYSFQKKEMKIVQWNRHGAIQEKVLPVAKILPATQGNYGKIILGPVPDIGGYGVLFYRNLSADSVQFTTLSFLEKSLYDPKRPRKRKAAEKITPEITIGKSKMKVPLVLFRSRAHFQNTVNKLPELPAKLSLADYQQLVDKMLTVLQDWSTKLASSPERLMSSANIFELLIASGYKPSLVSIHRLHKAEKKHEKTPEIKEKMLKLNQYLHGKY